MTLIISREQSVEKKFSMFYSDICNLKNEIELCIFLKTYQSSCTYCMEQFPKYI